MDIYLFNCITFWMSGKCFCINNENIVLIARKGTNNKTQVDNLTLLSNNVFIFKIILVHFVDDLTQASIVKGCV